MIGLDGVELSLIIVFLALFSAILSGFPVGFAIGGAGALAFAIIALLDGAGLLLHHAVDYDSEAFKALVASGVHPNKISLFRYPDLPTIAQPVFEQGYERALKTTISAFANRINERVLAGQSIETLLAVAMFILMGITLERSNLANDLLTTMAKVFGPLPGGLAVSVVIVGAFLAASTGIVGATVVTMGLLSLPTMLKNKYKPELSTGVIAASGTLGQIIPPSIVIVLLGTLTSDIYSTAQERRAQDAGCSDALTLLGEPAVISVGTLFQSALLPGIFLALLYAAYAFVYALIFPHNAPAIRDSAQQAKSNLATIERGVIGFAVIPILLVGIFAFGSASGIISSQISANERDSGSGFSSLQTNVSDACKSAMIELHGQAAWDKALKEQAAAPSASEAETASADAPADAQPALFGRGVMVFITLLGILFSLSWGLGANFSVKDRLPYGIGAMLLMVAIDGALLSPQTSTEHTLLALLLPIALALFASARSVSLLSQNTIIQVIFPPLILIIAVLGSILGGITNPTPAAALGAGGALMLAAYRKLKEDQKSGKIILAAAFAVVIMILIGMNFTLNFVADEARIIDKIAYLIAWICYLVGIFGLLYACYTLWVRNILTSITHETAKITSMVFTILIGSQLLNLVIISFGGEHYIQDFLQSFDNEIKVFFIVMLVLFILGFVLDFIEIIYIVVPIVGPIIYGGTLDPKWVTIMIAINLQTSFLTPPFGFALFYLRGVAPKSISTTQIYKGVFPFVGVQIAALVLIFFYPQLVTFLPDFFQR